MLRFSQISIFDLQDVELIGVELILLDLLGLCRNDDVVVIDDILESGILLLNEFQVVAEVLDVNGQSLVCSVNLTVLLLYIHKPFTELLV